MIWLQITANTGPAECCLGVTKAMRQLENEAKKLDVSTTILECVDGPEQATLRSVLIALDDGEFKGASLQLAQTWSGSLLWICASPYRPAHRRKNWFLGCSAFYPAEAPPDSEILFETTRASGPGGQHVNKTESAVRATHVATGISIKVQSERSQHANKRLAGQLLASKLAALVETEAGKQKAERRIQHFRTERGNAQRVFVGPNFEERKQ